MDNKEKKPENEVATDKKKETSEDKQQLSELITPMRVRKPVQRLEMAAAPTKTKEKIQIPKGKGKQLSEIKLINDAIGKMKPNDEILKGLHRLLYNRAGDQKSIKSNIRQFCGFDFDEKEKDEKEEIIEEKLGKWMLSGLKELCQLLNLDAGGTKVVIISRILDFLKNPNEAGTKTGKIYNNAVSKVAYEMFVDEKKKELKEAKTDDTETKSREIKDDKTTKKEKDKAMMENIKKMWEELSEEQQQKYEEEVKANKLVNSKGKIKPKPKAAKVKKVAKKAISKEKSAKKETKEKVKKSIEKAKGTKAKKEVSFNKKKKK